MSKPIISMPGPIQSSTPDLTKHPWFNDWYVFVISHPLIWFVCLIILLLLILIDAIAKLIPQLNIIRSKILVPIAKYLKYDRLSKSAIKSDICGHVNQECVSMRQYLPDGWVPDLEIKWVDTENYNSLLDDNKMILRIRPIDNQDKNFVNAIYYYFKSSFFPKTQALIPKAHSEASILYVCRNIVAKRGGKTIEIFEDEILEPAIQKHKQIVNNLEDYNVINDRGFFTGTFLRELHKTASEVRFTSERCNVGEETKNIIGHIKNFIDTYKNSGGKMPPKIWRYKGKISDYAILLVAKPAKKSLGVNGYVNRARDSFSEGVKRLYVFGANNEKDFAVSVISSIQAEVQGIKLIEEFCTPFDYRGEKGGIAACFEKN